MTQTSFKIVPFDIKLAKKITNKEVKGRIVNGMGSEVQIIYFNKKGIYPIVGLITIADREEVYTFNENGQQDINYDESLLDIHIEIQTYQESKHQLKPFDKVLVRDDDDKEWQCNMFSYIYEDGDYGCFNSWWKQCIPYEGNEHLLGTTIKPE